MYAKPAAKRAATVPPCCTCSTWAATCRTSTLYLESILKVLFQFTTVQQGCLILVHLCLHLLAGEDGGQDFGLLLFQLEVYRPAEPCCPILTGFSHTPHKVLKRTDDEKLPRLGQDVFDTTGRAPDLTLLFNSIHTKVSK